MISFPDDREYGVPMAVTETGSIAVHAIDDLSFQLARANAVSMQTASAALRPFGLKPRSYSVLSLALADHRPSQREIAEYLRLDPSQVVSLVDDLQKRGLVAREVDQEDRRAKVVVGTPEGARLHAEASAATQRGEAELLRVLDDAETAMLRRLLLRVGFPDEV